MILSDFRTSSDFLATARTHPQPSSEASDFMRAKDLNPWLISLPAWLRRHVSKKEKIYGV
jgi:hypothetical protein